MHKKTTINCSRNLLIGILTIIAIGVTANAATPKLFEELFKAKSAFQNNDYKRADAILTSIADECFSSDNDSIKVVYYETKGCILFFNGKFEECIPILSQVPTLYEKINLRDINYLESFLALGIANQKIGNLEKAEAYYRKGLLKSVLIRQPEKYRDNLYLNLGNLYLERNDSILANQCFVRMGTQSLGGLVNASLEGDDLLDSTELQAINLRKDGRFEEAVKVYDNIISYVKARIGTNNEDYARNVYSKAIVVGFNLGNPREAIPMCEEVISLKSYLPACEESIIGAYGKLLQFLAFLGESEKLETVLLDAVEYVSESPKAKEEVALIYRLIGNGAYWNQHFNIAIPYYEKYLASKVIEPGNSYLEIPNMLAVAYIKEGQHDNAILILDRILRDYSQQLDSYKDLKSQILHNLGRAMMLDGNKKEAMTLLTESNNLYKSITGQDNPKTIEYINACRE